MKSEKLTSVTYKLELNEEEFRALYDYLGCTNETDRRILMQKFQFEDSQQKSITIGEIFDDFYQLLRT